MSNQLGPLEVHCDAPPYSVVRACEGLGFQSPLDVRWCRAGQSAGSASRRGFLGGHTWKGLFSRSQESEGCSCGQALPSLDRYTFLFLTGKETDYLLGQCKRCRAIHWSEV